MTPYRRRLAVTRLVLTLLLLVAAIWLLYRFFLRVPPAPPPSVTPVGVIVPFPIHP